MLLNETVASYVLNSTILDHFLLYKIHRGDEDEYNISSISEVGLTMETPLSGPREPQGPIMLGPPVFDQSLLRLQEVVDWLRRYYIPSVIAVGLWGNVISIIVLLRTQLATLPAARYLAACTLVDILFLCSLLTTWLVEMGYPIYNVGAACHATTFARDATSFLSVWYTVCYSVDALIAIKFPNAERKMCTVNKAKIVIMTLAIVATAVFLNISLTVGVFNLGVRQACLRLGKFAEAFRTLAYMDVAINVVLPYCGLIAIGVTCAVQCYKDGVCQRRGPHRPPQRSVHMECDVEAGLMCQYFAFISTHLVFNLPSKLFQAAGDMSRTRMSLKHFLIEETLKIICNSKLALNFFVFLFAWRGFRETLKLACYKVCRRVAYTCCKRGNTPEENEWHFVDHTLDETVGAFERSMAREKC